MPATKYSFGRPRRLPLSADTASSSFPGSWSKASGTGTGALVESRSWRAGGGGGHAAGHGHRGAGRVAVVAAGDRVEQRRGVARVARERPDLVEGAGER